MRRAGTDRLAIVTGADYMTDMTHDAEYFRRRAAEARAAAHAKGEEHSAEVAGDLALAYAALARRRAAEAKAEPEIEISAISLVE
jgi:hypothetical protein